jgi:FKBP-type peptidyl-prolyl cis-trans isomerase
LRQPKLLRNITYGFAEIAVGVGDKIEIAVPRRPGYGPNDASPIRGGATLLVKIELLGTGGE